MAPSFRVDFPHESDPARAAVLALMYPSAGEIHMVFIKRNEYNGHHSAQVSFPGGAWENEDLTLQHTAIRETREELGISGEVEILGSLTDLHIPVSNFLVTPFVGWMDETPLFKPDPSEVQYVIEAPLQSLLSSSNIEMEVIARHDQAIQAPCYKIGKEKIWGATAMMLSEILELASRLPLHRC